MVEIEVANRSAAALDLEAAAQLIRDVLREDGIDSVHGVGPMKGATT